MTPRSSPTSSVLAIRSAASRSTLKVPTRLMATILRNASSGKTPSLLSTRMALPVPAQLTTMRGVPIASQLQHRHLCAGVQQPLGGGPAQTRRASGDDRYGVFDLHPHPSLPSN